MKGAVTSCGVGSVYALHTLSSGAGKLVGQRSSWSSSTLLRALRRVRGEVQASHHMSGLHGDLKERSSF
jgi:hypothetical protein